MSNAAEQTAPTKYALEIARMVHGNLPPLLRGMYETQEMAGLDPVVETARVSNIVFGASPKARITPVSEGYLLEGASEKAISALGEDYEIIAGVDDMVLAKRSKPKKKSKTKVSPSKAKSGKPANVPHLTYFSDANLMKIAQRLYKDAVEAEDFTHFTGFMHALDDVVAEYRKKAGHEDEGGSRRENSEYQGDDDSRHGVVAKAEDDPMDLDEVLDMAAHGTSGLSGVGLTITAADLSAKV